MSVLKVPLTLQSLSGKEENPHKNLASHAAKIMRDEEAPQIRPSAYRHLREILFRLQLQQELQFLYHRHHLQQKLNMLVLYFRNQNLYLNLLHQLHLFQDLEKFL